MPALSHDAAAAAELVRRHALVPCAGATLARTLFDAIDPDAQARRLSPFSPSPFVPPLLRLPPAPHTPSHHNRS
jgi:hypothetical protein